MFYLQKSVFYRRANSMFTFNYTWKLKQKCNAFLAPTCYHTVFALGDGGSSRYAGGRDFALHPLHHGCANHDTDGKRFKSSIHCCDVTKPPYLFSGELCTCPCTVNSCLCTPCAVGATGRASLCSEYVNQTSFWRSGGSSGRSYVTEQGHNVPLLRTRALHSDLKLPFAYLTPEEYQYTQRYVQ